MSLAKKWDEYLERMLDLDGCILSKKGNNKNNVPHALLAIAGYQYYSVASDVELKEMDSEWVGDVEGSWDIHA